MKHTSWKVGALVASSALVATALAAPSQAASPAVSVANQDPRALSTSDNLPNPLAEKQARLREEAVTKLVKGEASLETINGKQVIKLDGPDSASPNSADPNARSSKPKKSRYVQYDVNREESIFTVLTDFGTKVDPRFGGPAGPVHNQIAQPDRNWDGNATDDNSTYWIPDFNRDHFQNLMFGVGESFKDFYLKQSNGRFLAKGDVSDWVSVPYNETRYGAKNNADGYWNYIKDTAQAWYDAQKAAGKSDAQIADYLKQFDQVDRYDYDGDGNFNEPDG